MWRTPSNWKHFISISALIFSGCGVILLLIFLIKASLISSDTAGTTLVTCTVNEISVMNRKNVTKTSPNNGYLLSIRASFFDFTCEGIQN
jgi:hypothetical protein